MESMSQLGYSMFGQLNFEHQFELGRRDSTSSAGQTIGDELMQQQEQQLGDLIEFSDSDSESGLGKFESEKDTDKSANQSIWSNGSDANQQQEHHFYHYHHDKWIQASMDYYFGLAHPARNDVSATASNSYRQALQQNILKPNASLNVLTLPKSMTLERSKNLSATKSSRLHVSNIPFRYRREHLVHMFSIFGQVVDAEVIFNERGSKGFGFVSFVKIQDAEQAKVAFHGMIIDQRKIEVNYATPKPRKSSKRSSSSSKNQVI